MPIVFAAPEGETTASKTIFLSGSIPDTSRWDAPFDALEITDAVVSLARVCLTRRHRLVTAAHPTLAPLLMYVAAELPPSQDAQILVYQSLLFEDVLPTATRRFEADGIGSINWTEAAVGDAPVPGQWNQSLRIMRERMLEDTEPTAAVFVGGMDGIREEFSLFHEMFPTRPTYALGRPGGAAAEIPNPHSEELLEALASDSSYPSLWNKVLQDVDRRFEVS